LSDLLPAPETEMGISDNHRPDVHGEDHAGEPSLSLQPDQQSWQPNGGAVASEDQGSRLVKVRVCGEEHTFQPDLYVFKNVKGQTKRTRKKDWEQLVIDGEMAWVYHGKKSVYVSDI